MMTTKLLIEPIFEGNKELTKAMPDINNYRNYASHLIVLSAFSYSFKINVSHQEGPIIKSFNLNNIKIADGGKKYEQTFSSERVNLDDSSNSFLSEEHHIIFPTAGIYWLEAEADNELIETQQRMLDNKIERGWSKDEKNENKEPKKYFLRQPILVIDRGTITQIKLNKRLNTLTWAIVLLTAAIIVIQIFLGK